MVRVTVRFRSDICKLCMRDFESVKCILQTAKVGQITHNSQISKFLSLEHSACDAITQSSSDAHRDPIWAFKWARHQQACLYCISAVSHHGLESSALNMVYLLPSSHHFAIIMVIYCGYYCKCCPRKWHPGSRCWVTETTFAKSAVILVAAMAPVIVVVVVAVMVIMLVVWMCCMDSACRELSEQDVLQSDNGGSTWLEDVQWDACLGPAEVRTDDGRGTSAQSDPGTGQ